MIQLDPATREAFPGISRLFPPQKLPVSASFNGPTPANALRQVQVNPNDGVRCVLNKSKGMNALSQSRLAVPKWYSLGDFLSKEMFSVFSFIEAFGEDQNWAETPLHVRMGNGSSTVHDVSDLLQLCSRLQQDPTISREMLKAGVVMQPKMPMPDIVGITVIPNAVGKHLRLSGGTITNGVLTPRPFSHPIMDAAEQAARAAVDSLDLDYGTVTVAMSKNDVQILDVSTNLIPAHRLRS